MTEIYSNDMLKIIRQREISKASYERRKEEIKRINQEKKGIKPIKIISEEEIQRRKENRKKYNRTYQKEYQKEYIKEIRHQTRDKLYETIPLESRIMTGKRGRPKLLRLKTQNIENNIENITENNIENITEIMSKNTFYQK